MYIDTHAHLDFPEIRPHLDAVLSNARLAGVQNIITVGIDAETNRAALEIARQHDEIFASAGWHPHEADKAGPDLEEHIRALAAQPKVIALGEAGLDYFRHHSTRENQHKVFARMVHLAVELNKPLIVHTRDAFQDTVEIIRSEGQGKVTGVFHCFSGSAEELRKALDLDFLISYTGNITYKNSSLPPVVKATPVERLLLETDCPFMTPLPHRGKRNEPAYVSLVAARIAEIKRLSLEDVARITRFNTYRLFGIGEAPQNTFIYPIRNSLYIALTSRCTNRCIFCPRSIQPIVKGHYIGMRPSEEPSAEQVIAALGDAARLTRYDEVVFCGFGEPTMRFEVLLEVARWLKRQGLKVRVDTNGQGNLINRRNIVPEMVGLVDAVSISLNEHRSDLYQALVKSDFGETAFAAVLEFARECVRLLPEVTMSAVTYPGVNVEAVRQIAESIGAKFRAREYNEVG